MIKYEICPEQDSYFSRPEINLSSEKEHVKKLFDQIEKKNLEERLYNIQPGQRAFLYSFDLEDGSEVCFFFRCVENKKGHFVQRIESPNGMYFHSSSLKFTYE